MNTNRMLISALSFVALTTQIASAQVSPSKTITGAGAPIGIYATPTELLYSQPYCQTAAGTRVINSVNPATGTISPFATLPDETIFSSDPPLDQQAAACAENYFAISTGLGSFPNGNVYVNVVAGPPASGVYSNHEILVYPPTGGSAFTVFASLPSNWGNHGGVTFDTVGTFQNALIVTGEQGVIGYNAAGAILFQYLNPGTFVLENATVAPITYTPCGGCLLIAAENTTGGAGAIYAVAPGSPSLTTPTLFSNAPTELEALNFVPPTGACSLGGYSYFASGYHFPNGGTPISTNGAILAYTSAQLAPFVGQLLAPDEGTGNIYAFSAPNTSTVFSATGYQLEGATTFPCPVTATGCPATQGFWHKAANWPSVPSPVSVDGIIYGSDFSMTIGGIKYTQAELLQVMPSNPLHPGDYGNSLSQLVAAVLNVAAGAQHTTGGDAAIASDNAILSGVQIFCGAHLNTFCAVSSTVTNTVTGNQTALNNYNSAQGLGCSEGAGLTTGSGK